jgi:hypothetical protein
VADLSAEEERSASSEYQLKAAFVLNLFNFVEWPSAYASTTGPHQIGIVGESALGTELERALAARTIDRHITSVKRVKTRAEMRTCHLLFISKSETKRVSDILKKVNGSTVLTVSEVDRFTQVGGMINFVPDGNKMRFEINDEAAKGAGLRISSKLLNLARREPKGESK